MTKRDQFALERCLNQKNEELKSLNKNEYVDNLDNLINLYYKLKDIAYEKYYPVVDKMYPWYTNHGAIHVEAIIITLGKLLESCFGRFNEMEIFLLLCSALVHDTGMTKGREDHGKSVKEILKEINGLINDITIHTTIYTIAQAHTGKDKLPHLPANASVTYRNLDYPVNVRALGALLRFADDISETRGRIIPDALSMVPEENKIFWEYANSIESLSIDREGMNTICHFYIKIPENILVEVYTNGDDKTVFFDYLLYRLGKSYKEKVTCSVEFRNYIILSSFRIDIDIVSEDYCEKLDNIQIELNENYFSSFDFKESFYEKNPQWSISELKANYDKTKS